jgi:aminocarboxymuconate-semialdehyde decarboxylase
VTVIDIHSHFFPREWPDLAERFGTPDWPWIKHIDTTRATIMLGQREFRAITSACWDAGKRLEDMDRDGIDIQLLCATPVLFAYMRPSAHALDCARMFNDAALELCAAGKGRLRALCQVPLQDLEAACKEVSRAVKSGHIGVQIGNHVGDRDLTHESMVAFLHHCADENIPVLVHPWDMLGGVRTAPHMMGWTVSMPAETQLSIVAMIVGGAFDRLPRNLKICFAHGGGSFAFLLGRLENAWHHHPVARGISERPPSAYLDRFCVDSAVFDQRALRFLVDILGDEHVMLGSDYPFPLGEQRVGQLIKGSSALSDSTKRKLLGTNAGSFFGLGALSERPNS